MLAMLGLVGSSLTLTQMFLLELRELGAISWTFWEVPLLVSSHTGTVISPAGEFPYWEVLLLVSYPIRKLPIW